ncbi:MAG: hypothetical protein P8L85_24595 [Rubripirellula sp.]|nr:hypothetical protein [Rubripirellula sp.]
MNQRNKNLADSESNENRVPNRELKHGHAKAAKRSRLSIQFGLMELLLLTVVAAAWLPVVIAKQQIAKFKLDIQTLQPLTTNLIVMDEQKLNIRAVQSILPGITSWKYYGPLNADLELRFASEGINNFSLPTDYKAVPLPEGRHTIHLSEVNDTEGYHRELYIDKEKVLEQHLPLDAFARHSSSISTDVSEQSKEYPITEPLKLLDERSTNRHPLQAYGQIDLPIHHDKKGNFLWISPRTVVPKPAPKLIVYKSDSRLATIGHRQGIRVRRTSETKTAGLINIQPSISSVLGDQDRRNWYRFGISVRPILAGGPNPGAPEIPELQPNPAMPDRPGMPITYRDTITLPSGTDARTRKELVAENTINEAGDQMRLFAHYPPYASGAQPIVEILFDAAQPNRIGFLPHAAPGSTPLKACQFVTQFDARFFWRKIEMRSEEDTGADVTLDSLASVPLSRLYPQIDPAKFADPNGSAEANASDLMLFPWQPISLESLPRFEASNNIAEMFKMSLITDVPDSSKLKFPAGLPDGLEYEGVPNRQVWWLPAVEDAAAEDAAKEAPAETPITVEVRATSVFPTTKVPLVGGPAIGNVRITVPMPATEPIWLEIVAEQPIKL